MGFGWRVESDCEATGGAVECESSLVIMGVERQTDGMESWKRGNRDKVETRVRRRAGAHPGVVTDLELLGEFEVRTC